MRAIGLGVAVLALAGCAQNFGDEEATARSLAEQTASRVIANEFPNAPITSVGKCVADNADDAEIFKLAEAGLKGISGTTTQMVYDILRRSETKACTDATGAQLPI